MVARFYCFLSSLLFYIYAFARTSAACLLRFYYVKLWCTLNMVMVKHQLPLKDICHWSKRFQFHFCIYLKSQLENVCVCVWAAAMESVHKSFKLNDPCTLQLQIGILWFVLGYFFCFYSVCFCFYADSKLASDEWMFFMKSYTHWKYE